MSQTLVSPSNFSKSHIKNLQNKKNKDGLLAQTKIINYLFGLRQILSPEHLFSICCCECNVFC